jgi:hypothetical protein
MIRLWNFRDLLRGINDGQPLFGCHDIKEMLFAVVDVEFPVIDVDL